ncbi:uncharacterized protein LOC111388577 [Olea europaea var. sylvestris]|uniref:uncharacterized protein LOC111388577 n=1 Tax=Olea europaea var. sylvestris TaxID=158386 RepID=UPI000C1D0A53|nr:uncharacterized protein LOC111388577 [Olea europaea var. sylvestris]
MALGASIRGWKHCRPVVVVDGTYLNGHYGGTLFTACTQDANNSIYVLAFGIGDNENDSSWTWFFRQLRKVYGDRDSLCFVSDRHNSIKKAIENVYLGACHGICSYHLLQNLKSQYGRSGQNITQAFNAAVHAYTLLEYEYYMQQLDSINQKIRGYLVLYYMLSYDDIHINTFNMDEVGPERWSRFHMPSNRYSTMTSNIVELVNAVTKHKEDAQGTLTTLSIKYEKKIREMSTDMRNLWVSPINQAMFSVSGESSSFVVDIENRTCTCRMLQVDQLSCPHALAVFASMKMDPYEYCSYYYTSEAFRNTYQETIFLQSCERPTEKRFKAAYEKNITVKCGRCGESGHNCRTYNNLVPLSQSNKNKERKRMKTGNAH